MFENVFEKALIWSMFFLELTGQTLVLYNFSYFPNEEHLLDLCFFGINWTNLSPTSVDLIFTPPMLQTSDIGRSDRYCNCKSDIYIIIPRKCRPKDQQGVLLASAKISSCLNPKNTV